MICRYKLVQMKTSESVGSEPLGSIYIGYIRINFNIAFPRTRNDIIVNGDSILYKRRHHGHFLFK